MKRTLILLALALLMLTCSACGPQLQSMNRSWGKAWHGEEPAAQKEYDTPSAPAPAGNKLATVKLGAGKQEVYSIMGMPDSSGDTALYLNIQHEGSVVKKENQMVPIKVEYTFYKGYGTVLYAFNDRFGTQREVVKVTYNPEETGFRPVKFYEDPKERDSVLFGTK